MAGQNSTEIWHEQKKLKTGYTTGSCAAAATKAALEMLLSGNEIQNISLLTPNQTELYLEVKDISIARDWVSCGIQKDSGDDPDVTNGICVYARVEKRFGTEIIIDGGIGVGRVTRKGLEQSIGQAAINKVPREMIIKEAKEQCAKYDYHQGLSIVISVPEGVELAKKTFNPRLGIEGGISILGTTGIVQPMSEKALTDTIFLEMKMLKENGFDWCYAVPGNYGIDFLNDSLEFDADIAVKYSNYVGDVIDDAVNLDMKGLLFVGHIGKLIKVAAGVMNTHSRQADCRMEVLSVHAALCGADRAVIQKLMNCITTTEAIEILKRENLLETVMESVMKRVEFYLQNRAGEELQIGAILFSKEDGILGRTTQVPELLKYIQDQNRQGYKIE